MHFVVRRRSASVSPFISHLPFFFILSTQEKRKKITRESRHTRTEWEAEKADNTDWMSGSNPSIHPSSAAVVGPLPSFLPSSSSSLPSSSFPHRAVGWCWRCHFVFSGSSKSMLTGEFKSAMLFGIPPPCHFRSNSSFPAFAPDPMSHPDILLPHHSFILRLYKIGVKILYL